MTEANHTEGPWERVDTQDYAEIHPAGERLHSAIALVGKPADADLIAAAPEMLAALQLGAEYDDLLLRFKGPKVIFDGDVAEIDAAYDKWVAATRAALSKAGLPQ